MNYNCPVCQGILREQVGTVIHPGDPKHGIMLSCPHKGCAAQEVMGHGDNAKGAFEVITGRFQHYTKRK